MPVQCTELEGNSMTIVYSGVYLGFVVMPANSIYNKANNSIYNKAMQIVYTTKPCSGPLKSKGLCHYTVPKQQKKNY